MPRIRNSPIPASPATVIDTLENGRIKEQRQTLSHYLTVARMIPMRIDLWHNLERVFYAGIAEEDGSDKYTADEKRIYALILDMIPLYNALMPAFQDHPKAFELFVELIKESALGSRTGDVNTCKREVLKLWLPSKRLKSILRERDMTTVKQTDKKSLRGWNDAQCAFHLLPLRLHEEFLEDPPKLLLRIRSSQVKIRASEFPSFLYPEGMEYDQSKPLLGLFRGPLLVRMFRCLFTSPSSALNPHERGNSKTQAEIHKIRQVEPYGIAYVAVLTRQALSSSDWVAKEFHFDYRDFMNRILQLFQNPELPWVRNTLNWWNKQVDFSRSKTSGDETDTSSDDEHAVSMDDLLRSAADEEEIEDAQDDDTSIHNNDDWPDYRTGDEIAAQEREVAVAQEREAVTAREREVATAREREVAAVREREATTAQEQEVATAREQEVTAVREREATTAREREVLVIAQEREVATAREQEVAAAREPETAASLGKRKGPIEPDLSDLSEEEPLPAPRPVKTNQTNRGTGRKPPPKKKKR